MVLGNCRLDCDCHLIARYRTTRAGCPSTGAPARARRGCDAYFSLGGGQRLGNAVVHDRPASSPAKRLVRSVSALLGLLPRCVEPEWSGRLEGSWQWRRTPGDAPPTRQEQCPKSASASARRPTGQSTYRGRWPWRSSFPTAITRCLCALLQTPICPSPTAMLAATRKLAVHNPAPRIDMLPIIASGAPTAPIGCCLTCTPPHQVDFLATKQVSAPSPRFDLALCVGAPATHNTWTTAVARKDVYV